jgi:transcription elongation GreA/GreB family factor
MTAPNYLTPEGAQKLSEELRKLVERERPKVVQEVQEAAAKGTAPRMPNTFMARSGCARLTDGFAS